MSQLDKWEKDLDKIITMFRELKLLKLIYQYHIEESEVRYEHVKGEVDDLEKKFKKVNENVDAEDNMESYFSQIFIDPDNQLS